MIRTKTIIAWHAKRISASNINLPLVRPENQFTDEGHPQFHYHDREVSGAYKFDSRASSPFSLAPQHRLGH